MRTSLCFLALAFFLIFVTFASAQQAKPDAPIDMNYAQQLHQKEIRGEALTPEEKAYLDRAKAERAARQKAAANPPAPRETTGLVPLDQMTAQVKYRGEDGGLYGAGKNSPPESQLKAALAAVAQIKPLDPDGKPSPDGKIVLISLGMSNTTQEFQEFMKLSAADADRNPKLVVVDCAQSGQAALQWSTPDRNAWKETDRRLRAAGVTPAQVQVIWLKQADIQPAQYGEFPKHAQVLRDNVIADLTIARRNFPNLRVAYLSSRIYAGYATSTLNPEPYAYEGAFAMRWIIQAQVKGDARLNFDPAKGEAKAPVLLWGPYLWADGVTPRKSDGLVYKKDEFGPDGTHPAMAARQKVARLLLNFLKSDPTAKSWYLKPNSQPIPR